MKKSGSTLYENRYPIALVILSISLFIGAWFSTNRNAVTDHEQNTENSVFKDEVISPITSVIEPTIETKRRGRIAKATTVQEVVPPQVTARRGTIIRAPINDYKVTETQRMISETDSGVVGEEEPLVTFDTRPTLVLLEEAKHLLSGPDVDGAYDQAMADLRSIILREPKENAKQAHEWLGLAYEKVGNFDKAMNEYALYLTLYPEADKDRDRVRQRLLSLEILVPHGGTGARRAKDQKRKEGDSFGVSGSLSQYFYFGSSSLGRSITQWETDQMSSLTGVQFSLRNEHNQYILYSSVRFTEVRDLLHEGENRTRLSTAFVEFEDKFGGYSVRGGRQAPAAGAIGTFDGIAGKYKIGTGYTVIVAAGYPYLGYNANTARRFFGAEFDWNIGQYFSTDVYINQQTADGFRERLAFGGDFVYHNKETFLITRTEYDVLYQTLNQFYTSGRTVFGPWEVFGTYDRRRSPMPYGDVALTIGSWIPDFNNRPFANVQQLLDTSILTNDQIYDFIEKNTPVATSVVLGVNRRLNKDWVYTINAQSFKLSSTNEYIISSDLDPLPISINSMHNYSANFHLRGDNFIFDNNSAEFVIGTTIGDRSNNYFTFADNYRFGDNNKNSVSLILRYGLQNYGYAMVRTATGMLRGIYRITDRGAIEGMYSHYLIASPDYRTVQAFYIGYRYDF